MTTENDKILGFVDEQDAQDSAYRLAGRQLVKSTRDPLVAFLSKQLSPGDPSSVSSQVAGFLDTELGEALLAGMLAAGMHMLPANISPHIPRLARELRVKGLTDVGDVVADILMAPLRQVVSDYIVRPSSTPHALPQEATGREKVPEDISVAQEAKISA